jgi:hypothetical protein
MASGLLHWSLFIEGDDHDHDHDDDNGEGNESVTNARDARLRRAFHKSKESYKNELVVLTPGWFVCEPADVPNVANNQKLGLQNIGKFFFSFG